MKKHIAIIAAIALLFGAGCKSGKYSDINEALNDLIKIQDSYVTAIQGAQNAGDVAKAINSYADNFMKIKPRIESFEQKYPELKISKEPPEELKENFERLQKSAEKLATASMSMLKYLEAPEVQKAIERLKELSKRDDDQAAQPGAQQQPQQPAQQAQPQQQGGSKSIYQE
jgi:superfamily I DNA and/or RNA helicase